MDLSITLTKDLNEETHVVTFAVKAGNYVKYVGTDDEETYECTEEMEAFRALFSDAADHVMDYWRVTEVKQIDTKGENR